MARPTSEVRLERAEKAFACFASGRTLWGSPTSLLASDALQEIASRSQTSSTRVRAPSDIAPLRDARSTVSGREGER